MDAQDRAAARKDLHAKEDVARSLKQLVQAIDRATAAFDRILAQAAHSPPRPGCDLKTGEEWEREFGHNILDHDGWRQGDGVYFRDTRITEEDYRRRYAMCTVGPTEEESNAKS